MGIDKAGKPAREAGTVRTSWTYEFKSERLSVSRGAVRIAEGWSRISTAGEPFSGWVGESEKKLGIRNTRLKSSFINCRIR